MKLDWESLERKWMRSWEQVGFEYPTSFYYYQDIKVKDLPRIISTEGEFILDFWPLAEISGRTDQLNGKRTNLHPFVFEGPVINTLGAIQYCCQTEKDFAFFMLYCCLRQLERKAAWPPEVYWAQLEMQECIEGKYPSFLHTWHSNALNVLPGSILNGPTIRKLSPVAAGDDLLYLFVLDLAALFTKWKLVKLNVR